jgi:3-oxoacyl-[acyl-carrier protein] reductase
MKRALITGGAGTLGAAICRRLNRDGMHVIVHAYRRLDAAEAVAAEIRGTGGSAEVMACDLGDVDATALALQPVLERGAPQVVVHSAGIHDDAPMAGMSEAQWRRVIEVSLHGFYAVTRPLLLPMMATRWGRIVAISSVSAIMGNRGQVNYAAAKAGLIGAVRALSLELASRGVTVNAVAPGIIDSPSVAAAIEPGRIAELVPMKRAGRPEEVADLVGFLVSPQAGYITGQTISINGGMA